MQHNVSSSDGAVDEFRGGPCPVSMSPEAKARLNDEVSRLRSADDKGVASLLGFTTQSRPLGFDDGVIFPPEHFAPGTSTRSMAAAAASRAPLHGTVRVIVVLVEFSDKHLTQTAAHFSELFFSTGVLPHGSVREYFSEVTGGLVDLAGEVVGPYTLPQTLAWYANGNFGIGRPSGTARANIMANDAAAAADPHVDFGPYDNDGNNYVDAFIVVHAGRGGEETLNSGDIWSHKWNLPTERSADTKKIFAYLTIPEDSKIGVCAHELGHLLFGFPDLYDTDDTSEGVGSWCLMGAGSWNGGGDIPAHPSAWCKVQQGWAGTTNVSSSGTVSFPDVKTSRKVHRVWKDGGSGPEYFLLENRQRTGYDAKLPGDGLLIWHIDDNQPDNTDENHYKVGLAQADGQRNLELNQNRGDGGDPYPGTANNTVFTGSSTPSSNSYGGQTTSVSVTAISASAATMTAKVSVSTKAPRKDLKDSKDVVTSKESLKELKDRQDKSRLHDKSVVKDLRDTKSGVKDYKDQHDSPAPPVSAVSDAWTDAVENDPLLGAIVELEDRVAALESVLASSTATVEPFIAADQRPDLIGGGGSPDAGTDLTARMAQGDRDAKIAFDSPPLQ
ncbi:hypothetical protein GCM10009712_17220 [Pseudarthrobacter sulfonivorans]|uniref:M6 family metalloprotease domain-containing protein n=1 Tax=Pseudarthrobacter sulfonivorans TaxID=121292 RepID=UPI00168A6901|nr:M6 family metalloprotease domain-containing protein [Pseudarthrobacter sulfonivorans]